MPAVEAKAKLVDQSRPKDVRLVEREDLAPHVGGVAEARDCAAGARLDAFRFVKSVISVQPVVLAEVVVDVQSPLIAVDGSVGGTDEARRA